MSIFSRILKRGPEEGASAPVPPPGKPVAAKPVAAARDGAPSRTPAPANASKSAPAAERKGATASSGTPAVKPAGANGTGSAGGAVSEGKAVSGRTAAPVGVTQFYQAAAKPAAAANGAAAGANGTGPGASPARGTPARVATASPARSPAVMAVVPASPARAPAPAASGAAKIARRDDDGAPGEALSAPGSLDQVFEQLFASGAGTLGGSVADEADASSRGTAAAGRSTTGDQRTLMATFEDLAVGHTAQVRSFMLEVRWGEAQTSWIELARPALQSLRAMAAQIEHPTLVGALDAFDAALREALRPGAAAVIHGAARDKLLATYAPLLAAMPRAFELEGERDRREPVVVRALLEQVNGLDPLMIDRMTAVGLGRLEALFGARADEISVVAGIPLEVAAAVVAEVQAFRRATPAALAAADPAATARELRSLFQSLEADHLAFESAARGWSVGDRDAKKRLRRRREIAFLQITIALARLGEVDLAVALGKLSFARRIEELERLVSRVASASPSPPLPPDGADAPDYDQLEIERRMDSGAHAAP